MKALWHHELYVVIENHDSVIELEPMDDDTGTQRVFVSFADPTLIIDPTDGDLDEAEAARNYRSGCDECPHVTYFTIDVPAHRHLCHICGAEFTDPHRVKIYILTKRVH